MSLCHAMTARVHIGELTCFMTDPVLPNGSNGQAFVVNQQLFTAKS